MGQKLKALSQKSNGVAISSIYVFGQRNSGTNYVNSLIMRNCRASATGGSLYNPGNVAAFGWKHGFPTMLDAPKDVLAIAVYREPLAWLHSLHRAPWHTPKHMRNLSFSQFIRHEWQSVMDDHGFGVDPDHPKWNTELMEDRDPVTGRRFANAIQLRNAKNRGFSSLDDRFGNVLRINYETVVAAPQAFLNALCNAYGFLRLRKFDPIIHDRATPARGVFQPKPVAPVSAADLTFICSQLDMQQEASLGYFLRQDVHAMQMAIAAA